MVELSTESIVEAMVSCYNHFNLKVGVAFSSHERMNDFAKSMRQQYLDGLIPCTFYRLKIDELFFDTGSSIKMFNGSERKNLYGLDFDVVVVDPDIKDEDIIEHLTLCERRHFNLRFKNADYLEIDPEPLDEFLSEFKITKP